MFSQELVLEVCSLLSASVVVLSFFDKLPQIYKVVVSETSEGVCLKSVVLEMSATSILTAYQFALEVLLQNYFENIPFVLQDAVLTVIILYKRKQLVLGVIPYCLIYVFICIVISLKLISDVLISFAVYVSVVVLNLSKVVQLKTILENQSGGQISAFGWAVAVYSTAVRMLTTIVFLTDMSLLMSLVINEVLNVAVLTSLLYYGNGSTRNNRRRMS